MQSAIYCNYDITNELFLLYLKLEASHHSIIHFNWFEFECVCVRARFECIISCNEREKKHFYIIQNHMNAIQQRQVIPH